MTAVWPRSYRKIQKKVAGTWSAQFLLKESHLISEIYDEYIEAGSDIITTNTYSTIPSYFSKDGLEMKWLISLGSPEKLQKICFKI